MSHLARRLQYIQVAESKHLGLGALLSVHVVMKGGKVGSGKWKGAGMPPGFDVGGLQLGEQAKLQAKLQRDEEPREADEEKRKTRVNIQHQMSLFLSPHDLLYCILEFVTDRMIALIGIR